ncbi:MAG: hypothetical protein WD534_10040, partial [Phycisphaeraceae bacterium]
SGNQARVTGLEPATSGSTEQFPLTDFQTPKVPLRPQKGDLDAVYDPFEHVATVAFRRIL